MSTTPIGSAWRLRLPRRDALAAHWTPLSGAVVSARAVRAVWRSSVLRGAGAVLPTRVAWVLLAALYAAAGALVISTTAFPAAAPGRVSWVVQVMDASALASAATLLLLSRRLPRQALGPVVATSTVLITVCVLASGGGSTAVAYATVYLVGPVYSRFVMSARQADLQLVLVLAAGIPSLAVQPGVGPGEQMIVWGISLMLAFAVRWLVDALLRAETDQATGLPNRRGVERLVEESLVGAVDGSVGLVLLELDDVRTTARTEGRSAVDRLVDEAVAAWRAVLPPAAQLGRLGGDSFVVVSPGTDLRDTTRLAEALRATVRDRTGRCAAGSVSWELGETSAVVLERGEQAVQTAVRQGGDRTYEHPGTGKEGLEIRRALLRGEFAVHFQPIVALADGRVVGAEALVRWHHPERGLLLPGAFLAEVERCELIGQLGSWMLREACRRAAQWPAHPGGEAPYLSVNASGPELLDPSYACTVEAALQSSGLPPERLVVELVESAYDTTSSALLANLERLRELGVRTAIDDFGVGHSSLERLRETGGALLKIDMSFVADIVDEHQEAPLVLAVIALGDALGMRVVAEGVETAAQAAWLRRHGCLLGQGWLFGAAQPSASFTESLRQGSATSS